MPVSQSEIVSLLLFSPKSRPGYNLTLTDRADVTRWRERAKLFGYDRLVVHNRHHSDPPEVESFLTVYRRGEPWARWGVARRGSAVLTWCCLSGADLGEYGTVAGALLDLLTPGHIPDMRAPTFGQVITASFQPTAARQVHRVSL